MKPGLWSWVTLGMLLDFLALHLAWKWTPSPWGNPLAFLWAVAVGRCTSLVLAGGTLAQSGGDKLPWRLLLEGALVLSFQMPSYVSLQYLYQPKGDALHLAYNWGRSDILALNYLVGGAVMLLYHHLLPWGGTGSEKASGASFGRLVSCLKPEVLRFVAILVLMVFSCMGNATTELLCDFLYNTVMNRFHIRFQASVFRSVLRQEIGFFSTNRTGDITSHISSGIDSMSEALSHDLSLLMWYLLRGVCYYAMMLWISVPLAFFVIVTLPFILLLPKCSGKFYQVMKGSLQPYVEGSVESELSTVMRTLLSCYPSVQKAVGSSERAFEYMDRTPQIKPSGTLAPTNLEGHMELKDVSFSYGNNGNSLVLKGVSFKLCPGTVTALVGPSGCGKSTVVALLQRFYEPKQGQVALVSQDPILFARSLGANIAYGLEEQREEKVIQASQQVGVHRFISTMSHGYDTNAGEAGKQISGGQKQGIAIARALIRTPKVLILDDATSALDTDSQKLYPLSLCVHAPGQPPLIYEARCSWELSAKMCLALKQIAELCLYYGVRQLPERKDLATQMSENLAVNSSRSIKMAFTHLKSVPFLLLLLWMPLKLASTTLPLPPSALAEDADAEFLKKHTEVIIASYNYKTIIQFFKKYTEGITASYNDKTRIQFKKKHTEGITASYNYNNVIPFFGKKHIEGILLIMIKLKFIFKKSIQKE
ncbi:Antigen peptide transporter 1, partial [Ophiophagus hannah]